jgi:hypothetical protein
VQNILVCRPNKKRHKELLTIKEITHHEIKNQFMQGEEQIITHISKLESELELNEGLYLSHSQWQNHNDEVTEQQPQVILQLGRGKAASQLLVLVAGRSK